MTDPSGTGELGDEAMTTIVRNGTPAYGEKTRTHPLRADVRDPAQRA